MKQISAAFILFFTAQACLASGLPDALWIDEPDQSKQAVKGILGNPALRKAAAEKALADYKADYAPDEAGSGFFIGRGESRGSVAARVLALVGETEPWAFSAALDHPSYRGRSALCNSLAQEKAASAWAVPLLAKHLYDKKLKDVDSELQALARLGAAGRKAVHKAALDPDSLVQKRGKKGIAYFEKVDAANAKEAALVAKLLKGVPPDQAPLVEIIAREHYPYKPEKDAVTKLGSFGAKARPAVPALAYCLKVKADERHRWGLGKECFKALESIGGKEAQDQLELYANHDDREVSWDAMAALAKQPAAARPILKKLLSHPIPDIRNNAKDWLQRLDKR